MKKKLVLLVVFFSCLFFERGLSQTTNKRGATENTQRINSLKASTIVNFVQNVTWSGIERQSHFRVNLIGINSAEIVEIRKAFSGVKVQGLPVTIKELATTAPSHLHPVELLYINSENVPAFDFTKVARGTLVISENEPDATKCVISFIELGGQIKFSLNLFNANRLGLMMNNRLSDQASLIINDNAQDPVKATWSELVNTVRKNRGKTTLQELQSVIEKLNVRQRELLSQIKQVDDRLKLISGQTQQLKAHQDKLQQAEAERQEHETAAQEKDADAEQQSLIENQMEILGRQRQDIQTQEVELEAQTRLIEAQREIIILAIVACLSIIFGLVMLYRNFARTRKSNVELAAQKEEIAEQKLIIEEKHREITDSINYAERIQRSFLATDDLLSEQLKEYFVLFRPKDVVSGDFYWAARRSKDAPFFLCVADSTGHGVPGAIMSLLNITSLEKAIENLDQPADILNKTREVIIERLKKDGSRDGGKDGMDCSLVAIDFEKRKLSYAAAYNPIWIFRNAEHFELDPDKMPVGKHDNDTLGFTQGEFPLEVGDTIYLFTDGFPDQFGGPSGKKFMYRRLREMVQSISNLPMIEQRRKLESAFFDWKGELEQVDDVTVFGIRIH